VNALLGAYLGDTVLTRTGIRSSRAAVLVWYLTGLPAMRRKISSALCKPPLRLMTTPSAVRLIVISACAATGRPSIRAGVIVHSFKAPTQRSTISRSV